MKLFWKCCDIVVKLLWSCFEIHYQSLLQNNKTFCYHEQLKMIIVYCSRMQKRPIIAFFRRNLQNFERNERGEFRSYQSAWGTEFAHFFLKFSTKFSSKFDRSQVLKFSDMWKLSKHLFFSHYFNNNRKPVLQLKKFRSARRKKKSDNIRFFHLIVAGIMQF